MVKGIPSRQLGARNDEREDNGNDGETGPSQKGNSPPTIFTCGNEFIYDVFQKYTKGKRSQIYKTVCKGSIRLGTAFAEACAVAAKAANESETIALLQRLEERELASLFTACSQRAKGEQ